MFPAIPFPVRLPFGAWWLARKDDLGSMLVGEGFENSERAFVQRFLKPGMTVLDIGAHHGFYTILASKRIGLHGNVFAFEPSPREQRALRLHVRLNRCKNVRIEGLALGNERKEALLYVAEGPRTGFNSLNPPNSETETSRIRVKVTRLDDWMAAQKIERVDFIKLDVEGAELEVLRGAQNLLDCRPGPVILCELEDIRSAPWGHRAKEVATFLQALGFTWFQCSASGELIRLPDNTEQYEGNFVALRTESVDQSKGIITDAHRRAP